MLPPWSKGEFLYSPTLLLSHYQARPHLHSLSREIGQALEELPETLHYLGEWPQQIQLTIQVRI